MNRSLIAEAYLDCFLIAELCKYFDIKATDTKKLIRDTALAGADRIKKGAHYANLRMIASKPKPVAVLEKAWPLLSREFEKLAEVAA